jgi:hypothetical protein
MKDFSVYLTYTGNDHYQMFIKNNASEADFIIIIIGSTGIFHGQRVGRVAGSWIISPLRSTGEHVFIQSVNKRTMYDRRLWIAFEAVRRNKPKNTALGSFIALSPAVSKWRKTIGSTTEFDIKPFDSMPRIENSPSLARISRTISLSY